jgi:hypothetical protein
MVKEQKTKEFTVLQQITVDKLYLVGSKIELSDKKTIEKLISNKLIK